MKIFDGLAYSTGIVTITVEVGALPPDNNAPVVVSGSETQSGSAAPAADDASVPLSPYVSDVSAWFSDADASDSLTYDIVSATDSSTPSVDVTSDITWSGGQIVYIPDDAQALKTVTIVVKANDGHADSTGNVTITVAVGAKPANYTPGGEVTSGGNTEKVTTSTNGSGSSAVTTANVTLSGTTSGGTITASVTSNTMNTLISEASGAEKAGGKAVIGITIGSASGAAGAAVTIPSASLRQYGRQHKRGIADNNRLRQHHV